LGRDKGRGVDGSEGEKSNMGMVVVAGPGERGNKWESEKVKRELHVVGGR
jgi:hypothetical protein